MSEGIVTAIHLHPIKSCHRIEVEQATVSATGLEGDREWQVASGLTPVTQRQKAQLATVLPTPIEGGLRLSAPGQPTIEVARPTANDAVTGSLIGVKVQVGDAGDEAAAWFSALLGDEVRLVARTPDSELRIPQALDLFDQTIAFGDVAPVLVAKGQETALNANEVTLVFAFPADATDLSVVAAPQAEAAQFPLVLPAS